MEYEGFEYVIHEMIPAFNLSAEVEFDDQSGRTTTHEVHAWALIQFNDPKFPSNNVRRPEIKQLRREALVPMILIDGECTLVPLIENPVGGHFAKHYKVKRVFRRDA